MSEKKGWGSKVLGLFVEQEDELARAGGEGGQTVAPAGAGGGDSDDAADAAIIAAAAGAASTPGSSPALSGAPLVGSVARLQGGEIDFPTVFTAAGIGESERDRVDKAQGLLRSLPVETPTQVKRSIVEASLRAFGFPVESILEAALLEIQALTGCVGRGQSDTQKMLSDAQARIEQLTQEVLRVRQVMEQVAAEQADLERQCNQQRLVVQQVLEFFGQEMVAKVMRESPRLRGPEGPPAG